MLDWLKFSIVKGGKLVLDCIRRVLNNVKDSSLIQAYYDQMLAYLIKCQKLGMERVMIKRKILKFLITLKRYD